MDIFDALRSAADLEKAGAMSAYLKDKFPFLGIQKSGREALYKDFLAQKKKEKAVDWDFIEDCWALHEREFHYLGLDYILLMKDKFGAEDLDRLERLITRNSWWDTVDMFNIPIGRLFLKHPEIKDTLRSWITDENMWIRRMSILFQLHLKGNTDKEMLAEAIEKNLGSKEFFINKAIGWALREYSKTDPDWVRTFLRTHMLAPLSVREASKYI